MAEPLSILFMGEGYVAVDKPPGVLVIPGRSEESGSSLRELLRAQLGQEVWVVHRLDRDTSGVLLFALDARVHRLLSMAFEAGQVEKHYLALVKGALETPRNIDTPLLPARRGRTRPVKPQESGKAALTLVRPLEHFALEHFGERATLVDAQPLTGRTHQIRVHLLSVGHPLLVDPQYAQPSELCIAGQTLLRRTPLHAAQITLPTLEGISPATLHSPVPPDIATALEHLRAHGAQVPEL